MKKIFLTVFVIGFFIFELVGIAGAMSFSDDFNDGNMDGWTQKIGSWSVGSDQTLSNSGSVYGVVWRDNSIGVNQKIQVDAYFDFSNSSDSYAHLRLRTNKHIGATQPFWDTGYLADFRKNEILILNTYASGNPVISSINFNSTPFIDAGWYNLAFGVDGTGADTHFSAWVNGTKYIDESYNNTIADLDSGYVGLGRKMHYDNVLGYSSTEPVPEPSTILLLGSGLLGLSWYGRKRKKA